MGEVDAMVFNASRAPARRLDCYAIKQGIPSIQGLPTLDNEQIKAIAKGIMAMKGNDSPKQWQLLSNNNISLSVKPISYRGAP